MSLNTWELMVASNQAQSRIHMLAHGDSTASVREALEVAPSVIAIPNRLLRGSRSYPIASIGVDEKTSTLVVVAEQPKPVDYLVLARWFAGSLTGVLLTSLGIAIGSAL